MPNTHILQDLKKFDEEMNSGKRKKKTFRPNTRNKSSKRRGKQKMKPSLVNMIASIAQRVD